MRKKIILLGAITISGIAFSQVGVNTETPTSTFDIHGKKDSGGTVLATDITGLQAPRLTRLELTNKGNLLYGTNQTGAIIYITDVSTGNNTGTQRANVTSTGYYYFDGTAWQKISSSTIPAGLDTTDDAFVNDAANTMVKLGTSSTGTARTAITDFVVKDTGFLGIGTQNPSARIEIVGTGGSDDNITMSSYATTNNDGVVRFQKAEGTVAVPTAVTAGQNLGTLEFRGHSGTEFLTTAKILGVSSSSESITTTALPTDLVFQAGSNGNSLPVPERMRITSTGNIGIGVAAPTSKLHISATAGTGFRLVDTTQGAGKVLTSDASGNATWQTPASSAYTAGTGINITGSTISATDATTTANGIVRLAGDLTGTAASPLVANNAITTAKILNNAVTIAKLPAGATATTFLRGDGTWVTPSSTTYTASNGLTLSTNDVRLGGNLSANTAINGNGFNLTFNTTTAGGNKFISDGTSGSPKSALQIQDGTQGVGKVLTSDANGNAVWATPADRQLIVTAEITANYSLLAADDVVLFNNPNAIDFTLPTSGVMVGRKIYVSSINTGTVNYKPDNVMRNTSFNNLPGGSSGTLLYLGGGKWEQVSGF